MSWEMRVINCDSCGSMNDPKWKVCCKCGADPLVDAEGASWDRAVDSSQKEKQ